MKWNLCEKKNHSGVAKPRKFTIQRQSILQSTRTQKTYCSSHTFNYNMKPIVNVSQPSFSLEGVFDEFHYLRAEPYDRLHTNNGSTQRQWLES
jgi:hypothetical protein